MSNAKKILFDNFESHIPQGVVPAKTAIPQWYKNESPWVNRRITSEFRKTFKICMPFFDALTSGYCLTLPMDILVENNGEDFPSTVIWKDTETPMVHKRTPEISQGIPIPDSFEKTAFSWVIPITLQLPKGYSLLFTHPFNRLDLPFYTLTGVVDLQFALNRGSIPFFLQKGFSGIIPQGTPYCQVIPFKRESWVLEHSKGLAKEAVDNGRRSLSRISGWYRDTFWHKKSYN
jgi:hypothetical protein